MGKIAKIGIRGGKRVPSGSVDSTDTKSPDPLDPFTRRCLRSYGFLSQAERLLGGRQLTFDDTVLLLTRAPLPVLLKLVSMTVPLFKRAAPPIPVIVAPLEQWLQKNAPHQVLVKASSLLKKHKLERVHVHVPITDFFALDLLLIELLSELRSQHPTLQLVGPPLPEIVDWVQQSESSQKSVIRRHRLETILSQLKNAGFDELGASAIPGQLRLLSRFELNCGVLTELGGFHTPESLARHFMRFLQASERFGAVSYWMIDVRHPSKVEGLMGAGQDMRVLRALAVGTLLLKHIPNRFFGNGALSEEATGIGKLLGAAGSPRIALDKRTQRTLHLPLPSRTRMEAVNE